MKTETRAIRRRNGHLGERSSHLAIPREPVSMGASVLPARANPATARTATREQFETTRTLRRRRAAILDLDGTLVDSNEAQALSWLVALHDFGYEVALDLLRPLVGMPSERIIHHAIGATRDAGEGERILQRRAHILDTWYLPRLLPFVGTRALLQRMKRERLRLVVATTALHDEAMGLVRASGIGELLDDVVTASDSARWPESDVIATAIERTRCPAESVVLLGDTPYDVAAGARAGIDVVGLRCGGWRDAALRGAAAIYDDACDLLRNFSMSPFFSPLVFAQYHPPELTLVQ